MKSYSLLPGTESGRLRAERGRPAGALNIAEFRGFAQILRLIRAKARYSAATASKDLGFAAETMKSEMRGTISDLNREPLNTP
jgi:hypothetical protein